MYEIIDNAKMLKITPWYGQMKWERVYSEKECESEDDSDLRKPKRGLSQSRKMERTWLSDNEAREKRGVYCEALSREVII